MHHKKKGADLRGSAGGTSGEGELPEKPGKLPVNLWISVKFHSSGRNEGGSSYGGG